MKNITLTVLVTIVGWLGIILSLIMLYASPDEVVRSFESSLFFFASSVFVFSFFYNLNRDTSSVLKWINILLGLYYMLCGMILSLICLYAHPSQEFGMTDPLGAVIFFSGSMLVGAGLFFMAKEMRHKSEKPIAGTA